MQASEKRLFTPGPLNTSRSVKEAMLQDLGSRDQKFIQLVDAIRNGILQLAGVSRETGYEAILMQGSGTFAVESVLSTVIGPEDRLLILSNGAYGRRMADIAKCLALNVVTYEVPEDCIHDRQRVAAHLEDAEFTHLAVVHCETTTGILNPVEQWSDLARQFDCRCIVDAMSSFGGVPLDLRSTQIDYLVSSANKCIQGVPGFGFVVARRESLSHVQHEPRCLSLNLLGQLAGLERDGQFRFTPPTHVMLAFAQALRELEQEGGVEGRAARYRENHQVLCEGMRQLGFQEIVPKALQSHIITAFLYPNHPLFEFTEFYRRLSDRGMLIYPGKLTEKDCFRIGNIGHLFREDIEALLTAIAAVLVEMQIAVPEARFETRL